MDGDVGGPGMCEAQRDWDTEPQTAGAALDALAELNEAIENGAGGDLWRGALFSLRRQLGARAGVRLLGPVEERSARSRQQAAPRAHP